MTEFGRGEPEAIEPSAVFTANELKAANQQAGIDPSLLDEEPAAPAEGMPKTVRPAETSFDPVETEPDLDDTSDPVDLPSLGRGGLTEDLFERLTGYTSLIDFEPVHPKPALPVSSSTGVQRYGVRDAGVETSSTSADVMAYEGGYVDALPGNSGVAPNKQSGSRKLAAGFAAALVLAYGGYKGLAGSSELQGKASLASASSLVNEGTKVEGQISGNGNRQISPEELAPGIFGQSHDKKATISTDKTKSSPDHKAETHHKSNNQSQPESKHKKAKNGNESSNDRSKSRAIVPSETEPSSTPTPETTPDPVHTKPPVVVIPPPSTSESTPTHTSTPSPSSTSSSPTTSEQTSFPKKWRPANKLDRQIREVVDYDKLAMLKLAHPELANFLDNPGDETQINSLTVDDLKSYVGLASREYSNDGIAGEIGQPISIANDDEISDGDDNLFVGYTDQILEGARDTYSTDPGLSVVSLAYLNDDLIQSAKSNIESTINTGSDPVYDESDDSDILRQLDYRLSDGTKVSLVATWSQYEAGDSDESVQKVRWNVLVPLGSVVERQFGLDNDSFVSVPFAEKTVDSFADQPWPKPTPSSTMTPWETPPPETDTTEQNPNNDQDDNSWRERWHDQRDAWDHRFDRWKSKADKQSQQAQQHLDDLRHRFDDYNFFG